MELPTNISLAALGSASPCKVNQASLLGLPVEVRLIIYRYCLPAAPIFSSAMTAHGNRVSRRNHEYAPMGICRRMRFEIIALFYTSSTFCIALASSSRKAICFMGQRFTPNPKRFPTTLHFVTKLQCYVDLQMWKDHAEWSRGPMITLLVDQIILLPRHLKSLNITFYMPSRKQIQMMQFCANNTFQVEGMLDWNTATVNRLIGLGIALKVTYRPTSHRTILRQSSDQPIPYQVHQHIRHQPMIRHPDILRRLPRRLAWRLSDLDNMQKRIGDFIAIMEANFNLSTQLHITTQE